SCRREIVFFSILADRAIGGKGRSQAGHTFAHASDPTGRNPMLVADIELRDYFSFEQCIETFCFSCIPGWVISVLATISDRPAYFRGIGLRPPAIEFRYTQPAVHPHLHPACAACFPGPS